MNPLILKFAAVAAGFLLWSLFMWTKGADHVQQKWDAAVKAQEVQTLQNVVRLAKAASDIDKVNVVYNDKIREKVKLITKQVPVYVTKESDAKCDIPVGFIRLWDEPLSSAITPDSSILSNEDSSGVALSRVALDGVLEAKERFEFNKGIILACQSYIREIYHAP